MTKPELRKYYLQKRKELSPKELEDLSEKICHIVFSSFQLENKKISLFLPIENKKEINTYKIWEKAISFGATVAIPKMNMSTLDLKHIVFDSINQLEVVQFGIPEPKKGKLIAAEHFDYVFVPLLAIDYKGNRVGYGKGVYDRFLKKCSPNCKFIGLTYFDVMEDEIPEITFNDIKLDVCVTPNKLYRFK